MLKGLRDFVTRGNLIEVAYGDFINAMITFVSTAGAVYLFVVMPYQEFQRRRGVTHATRPCPECTTEIAVAAKRCPSCTAVVAPAA